MPGEEQPKLDAAGAAGAVPEQVPGQGTTAVDGAGGKEAESEKGEAEEIKLSKKELQAVIDREVTKALRTRTSKLEKTIQELSAELEDSKKKVEEADLTLTGKLEVRERELKQLKERVTAVMSDYESLAKQLEELVKEEIDSLSEEDREVALRAFPDGTPVLARLRGIRALKNAGKLSPASVVPERPGPGKVGTVTRFPAVMRKNEGDAERQERLVKEFTRSTERETGGYVPPEWQNR